MKESLDTRIEHDFDLALKLHNNEIEETDKGVIYNLLNIVDPIHSIVINKEIGLLGNGDYKVYSILDKQLPVGEIIDTTDNTIVRRGNYFTVLEESIGASLLDDYITDTLIIYRNNHIKDYGFILKDYRVIDDMNKALVDWGLIEKESAYIPALILYEGNNLYTNCKELGNKYIYNKDIQIDGNRDDGFKLVYKGNIYKSSEISKKNGVYQMNIIRMHI